MRRIISLLIIIVMLAVLILVLACCETNEHKIEDDIMQQALKELEIKPIKAEIKEIYHEYVAWSEWDYYCYILKADGSRYIVGVMRNNKEIHTVDVEAEF